MAMNAQLADDVLVFAAEVVHLDRVDQEGEN